MPLATARLSRALLLLTLLVSGVVHAVSSPDRDVAVAGVPVDAGFDTDGTPLGLAPDDEAAWVFAHMPVIHVSPVSP